jgi:hypothetical protein
VRQGKVATTDGPFAETKEQIAGYTMIQLKTRAEAVEWSRRFPNPTLDGSDCEIGIGVWRSAIHEIRLPGLIRREVVGNIE